MKNRTKLVIILLLITSLGSLSNRVQGQVFPDSLFFDEPGFSLQDMRDAGWNYKTNSAGFGTFIPAVRIFTQTSGSTYYYDSPFSSFRTYLSGAGTWTYLISPRLSGDLSNYQFRMSCKAAEGALFIVGALDDLSDTVNFSTFQPIDTVSGQGLGTFERPDISFSDYDYDGEPHHIVIKMPFIDKKQDFSIDNIIISLNQNCRPATNVVVENVAGSVAQISWTPSTSTVSSYDVEYAPVDSTNWQSMGTEDANITLSGLFERTDYKVRVVSNCGETSERTEPVYFSTGCDAYSYREIAPQQNTNGGHLPTGNNYSVSQQLFLAEEFDNQQQSIEFLAFQFNNPKALNRELMIFMKHVADTAFSSTQNWADTATMQQVFNGTATLSNSGEDHWTTIQFKTPFQFNGTENLLVCVLDFTGSSHGVTSDVSSYYTHTTSTNRSMSVTSALSSRPIDLDSLKSNDIKISNNRSNIRFISCATADCAMPLLANITDVTKNALTLNWVDNGTPGFYIIEYKPDTNSDWQRDTTTNYPSHTINGLQSGVLYHIRIARLCTEAVSNFTTPLQARTSCDKISVPYYEYFDSYANDEEPACWITQSGDNTKTGVTTSIKYEGAASFRMSASRDTFCLAVLPEIEDEHLSTSLTVSFWAKTDDLSGEFSLGFITDMDDIPTFESTSTLILNTPDTWKRFDIPLFVDDNTKRLALVWQDGTTPLYIDQFQITVAADCPAPTELNSSQIGVNQATISWENEDATTDKWIVSHHIKNDSLSLSVDTVWAATALLDNLLPNTSYVVLVTAICGDMLSESSAPFYFTTRPALASTPYDCDFENASENMNWVLVNGNHVNTWNINTAANNTAQGTQSLYISENNGTSHTFSRTDASNVWAYRDIYFGTTPAVYNLSFDWIGVGESNGDDHMKVYIADTNSVITAGNTTPPANAVQIGGSFYKQPDWTTANFTLSASYQGEVKRLIFYWRNDNSAGTNPPAGIDNIAITPTCYPISGLNVLSATADSATISWNRGGEETQWQVEYDTEGFVLGTGTTMVVNDTFAVLTNLSSGSLYRVYVAAKCGDNIGQTINTTFATTCPPIAFSDLTYTEDFENWGVGTNSNFPACWDRETGNSSFAYIENHNAHNALKMSTMPDEVAIAILPELDADIDLHSLRMSLSAKTYNALYTLVVGFMENDIFVSYDTLNFSTNSDWEDFTVRFADYQGTGNRIALKAGPYLGSLHVDDVTLFHVEDCLAPTDPVVSNIESSSASVSWTPADSSHNKWKVYYKSEDATTYTEEECTVPHIDLTSLNHNKTYQVKITTLCESGDESDAIEKEFTTPTLYITIIAEAGENGSIFPEGTFTVEINSDTTLIVRPDEGYEIEKVLVNNENIGTDSIVRLTNISTTMTVKAFFMESDNIDDWNINLNIYPNPAHNELFIQSDLHFENYTIMNIMGQQIASDIVKDLHFTLNVSNLKSGVYFIRLLNSDGTSVTRKFIKE